MGIAAIPENDAEERVEADTSTAPSPSYGPYLDESDEDAFRRVLADWKKDKWQAKLLAGQWKQNKWWRDGKRFVRLVSDQDQDVVRLVTPLGIEALPPTPNKTEELVRNAISIMLADPPRPECEPSRDTAQAVDAAQNATRFLTALATESQLNTDAVLEAALDIAATYGSGFAHVCYDPTAAGLRPKTIQARVGAPDVASAMQGDGPIVSRYVREDDTLSETPSGAKQVWQPGLTIKLYTGNQVRFMPRTCLGIADAKGVLIGEFQTLGDLKSKYPTVAQMSPAEQWELAGWKLDDYKRLLPEHYEYQTPTRNPNDRDGPPDDDTLICTLTAYWRSHPTYPRGAYTVFAGGKYRIHKDTWMKPAPVGENGETSDEALDIPVAQMRWRTTSSTGNPYGMSLVSLLGPMDEMRATQYASALEYLWKFSKPRPYLPMGTIIQPEDLADFEKPLYYNPAGKPEWQPMPDFPQMGMMLVDRLDSDMENAMSIQGPALGQVAGSVRSAEQQKIAIEQSNVGLTALRSNAEDFYERLHRILLQLARVFIDKPVLMRYQADDGAYQVQELVNTDFRDTSVVRVRKGTFTTLAPTQKTDMIATQVQNGMLDQMEAQRLLRDNLSTYLGLVDNPHVKRVRRQIQRWRKGPPDELLAQAQQPQQAPPQVDPNTGQPIPPPDPVALAARQIFAVLPTDQVQQVAQLRHMELAHAVAEIEFYDHPPAWKQALLQAYEQCRQAAGIVTVAEQQKAQQDAQQEANERQQKQAEAQSYMEDKKIQSEVAKADLDLKKTAMMDQFAQQKHERMLQSAAMKAQGVV